MDNFEVAMRHTVYGYVRVRAKDKKDAETKAKEKFAIDGFDGSGDEELDINVVAPLNKQGDIL